jgi:hypothetical protein
VIYRLIVPQADAQEVLHNVYFSKMNSQARVIRHHPVYQGDNPSVAKRLNQGTNETEGKIEYVYLPIPPLFPATLQTVQHFLS